MANENYIIGSVSYGTMRAEDLIPCFLSLLDDFGHTSKRYDEICVRRNWSDTDDYYNSEDSHWDLEWLFDTLQEYAPPYFYFGSHPGDGADYGFWLCENVADDVRDSGGYVVEDLGEISVDQIQGDGWPDSDCVEVLHVNDHGNCTLYSYNVKTNVFTEIWAVV